MPLKVKLKLYCTDEDHEDFETIIQDVYFGNVPYMTPKGTFVINGAERVIVSQLHRSPGVFFGQSFHANGTKLYSARVIPFKGSWIEFATDINNVMFAYIDRKKKLPVTTLLRAIGFESDKEIRFFFDSADRNYDYKTGKTLQDKISVLSINTAPDVITPMTNEVVFNITKEYRDVNGYVDSKKIELTHYDSDQDGIVDNPTAFDDVVASSINPLTKYIFQKRYTLSNVEDWRYVDATTESIIVKQNTSAIGAYSTYVDDSVIYLADEDAFKIVDEIDDSAKKNKSVKCWLYSIQKL